MEFRDHPLLSFQGSTLWPPVWIDEHASELSSPKEVGVLREVRYDLDNPCRIFVTMEYEGVQYIGCILMQNEFFGEYMAGLLKKFTGMTIDSIGSLEISIATKTLENERID